MLNEDPPLPYTVATAKGLNEIQLAIESMPYSDGWRFPRPGPNREHLIQKKGQGLSQCHQKWV